MIKNLMCSLVQALTLIVWLQFLIHCSNNRFFKPYCRGTQNWTFRISGAEFQRQGHTGGRISLFLHTGHTICSLNIPNNSLYNASYYMCRKITSHWQPLFSKKMAAAASFSYKIGGGGLIFLQNWRWRPHFLTKLAAAARIFATLGLLANIT